MPWWMWVATLLAWIVLASAAALWLGASAKVIREKEQDAASCWGADEFEWERPWSDAA